MPTQRGAEQAAPAGGVGPNGPTVGDARIGDTLPDNDAAKREHELAFEGALKAYVEKHAKNIRLLTKEQQIVGSSACFTSTLKSAPRKNTCGGKPHRPERRG